jgi:peptidyl-prolyl cis-trans isomerase D
VLITKFNRLVRNKKIWGCFAVIICIMFVGTFSPTKGGCSTGGSDVSGIGKLYDQPVSREEYVLARSFEMGLRETASLTPEQNELLQLRTWQRLAALRTAEKMGITVSDQEVADVIRHDPNFLASGTFSQEKYLKIISGSKFTNAPTFESYLREELLIRRLISLFETMAWTSPSEMSDKLNSLTDSFVLEYTVLNLANLNTKVTVTDEDTKDFFENNKKLFEIPEKVSVRYVAFPISNYLAEVQGDVKDEDVKDYYEYHIDEYSVPATNGTAATTNEAPDRIPLDDVKAGIVEKLKRNMATYKAKDAATEFVMALTPDRDGNAPTMDSLAASHNMTICTTALFAINERLPQLAVDHSFNKAAFDLDTNEATRAFSDAIVGSNAVYLVAANERIESRMPSFEEVIDAARPLARRQAELKAARKETRQIHEAIAKALESGSSFSVAAVAFKLSVHTTQPFTVYNSESSITNEMADFEDLLPVIATMKQGELTETVDTTNGVVIAYVKERTPGDLIAMETLRPQLLSTLDRYRASLVFSDWRSYVLVKAGYTNTATATPSKRSDESPAPYSPLDLL